MHTRAEEVGADHFRSSAMFLTALIRNRPMGSDVYNGTSIDQFYAQKYGQDTPLPSIQLCTENVDSSGACGFNYACVYIGTDQLVIADYAAADDLSIREWHSRISSADGGSPADRAAVRRQQKYSGWNHPRGFAAFRRIWVRRDRNRLNTYLETFARSSGEFEAIEKYNASNADRELPTRADRRPGFLGRTCAS